MSREALEAVRRHSQTRKTDLIAFNILLAIAEFTSPRGEEVYPGLRRLAKEAGCSKNTVTRKIRMLEEMGELAVRREEEGQKGKRHHYRLLLPFEGELDDEQMEQYERPEAKGVQAMSGVGSAPLAQQVALLRQEVDALKQTNTQLVSMVTTLSQQLSHLLGTGVPEVGHSSSDVGKVSHFFDTTVPMPQRGMGTVSPPLSSFMGDSGTVVPDSGTVVPEVSQSVPLDQRDSGTVAHFAEVSHCPKKCPSVSQKVSQSVPTLQSNRGTKTIETNKPNNSNNKTLSPSPAPPAPPPDQTSAPRSRPSGSSDPAVRESWNQLMGFVREREERHGRGGFELGHYQQLAGNIWRLKKYFCEATQLGEIPLDTPPERETLRYQWWPTMYDLLTMSGGDMEACQAAIEQAIVELDNWKDDVITAPKSIRNKAKAILAGAKRQSARGAGRQKQGQKADLKGMWQQITSTAGIPGGLRIVFEADPKARQALGRAGITQSDLRIMRPTDAAFAYKRFEEAYHEI